MFTVSGTVYTLVKLAFIIFIVCLLFVFAKRKEARKTVGCTLIVVVVTYFALVLLGGQWIWAAFRPYMYFALNTVTLLYISSVVAGLCCLDINWLIVSARKKTFDALLAILSFIIPLVGLILCIVNRAKENKDIPASNVYLAVAVLPGLMGALCAGVLSILGVM